MNEVEDDKYEFQPNKPRQRGGMDVDELNDRLNDATKGKGRLDILIDVFYASVRTLYL